MTNTEGLSPAGQIVDRIFSLLAETALQRKFDDPINAAVQTFACPPDSAVDYQSFHRLVGRFIQHIYEQGLQTPWKTSLTGPAAVGISLLENHYQGTCADGYAAARLDAADPRQGGITTVLHRLAEAVKISQRQQYIRWVFARFLPGCDWPGRVAAAAVILERFGYLLPASLKTCPPAQLAEDLPGLIQMLQTQEATLARLVGAD